MVVEKGIKLNIGKQMIKLGYEYDFTMSVWYKKGFTVDIWKDGKWIKDPKRRPPPVFPFGITDRELRAKLDTVGD